MALAALGLIVTKLGTGRYFDLGLVMAWIAVLAPVKRRVWWRVDRTERQLLLVLDAEGVGAVQAHVSPSTTDAGIGASSL